MSMSRTARDQQRVKTPSAVALIIACCVAVLSGCVTVPTSGPAERIEGQAPACRNCVNVDVAPPSFGDEPKQIVEGYLRATSNYQPNYAVAKQYLTKAAAEKWRPEDGASIYSGTPAASGKSTVILDGRLIGSLGSDRTYTAKNSPLKVNFGVVSEDGQWRISKPPPGLLVAEYSFLTFYKSYNIYFIGNGTSLVPDPIYLPNLPNQANIASVLMKALLTGPSKWLQPAVTSAIPANTALSVDSVTVQDGVAEVPLSDAVLPLNDRQRSLLTAQVVYTLKQAAGVERVVFKVNQKPFSVPGADEDSFEVSVDAVPPDVDPIPFGAGEQLYAVRGKAVELVDANAGSPNARPMSGPLGQGKYDVDSLAVSVTNTDLAVVTDGGTVLRKGPTSTSTSSGNITTLATGVTNLLRPQFSRYGELWALGRLGGQQRLWMFGAGKPIEVGGPILAGGTVTAFKISPDGARIALVRTTGKRTELGIARISRSDKITVDGWRPLDTNQSSTLSISRIQDVAWLDATDMLVLGASSPGAAMAPYRVSEDASRITPEGEPSNWDAVQLSVPIGGQTAIIIGRAGQTWKDDGTQWLPFIDKCQTLAFPG